MAISSRPIATWVVARRRLRHRWRSWVLLALLTGVAGGAVIGAIGGARRTATVYDRLVEGANPYDVAFTPLCPGDDPGACESRAAPAVKRVLSLPEVADGTPFTVFVVPIATEEGRSLQPDGEVCYEGSGEVDVLGSTDPRAFATLQRPHVVDGRRADPGRADEVLLSAVSARRAGVDVGDRLEIVPISSCTDVPREEWPAPVEVTVVGIQLSPGEVEPQSGLYTQSVGITRPLLARLLAAGAPGTTGGAVRLHAGTAPDDLVAAARDRGVDIGIVLAMEGLTADVEDGLRSDSTTLWLLAAFAAVAAAVVLGQALTRQVWGGAEDFGTLRAIGHTSRDLAAVGALEGAVLGVMGGAAAAVVAVAASPLAPIGRAREVETDAGVRLDVPVVALGGVAVIVTASMAVAVASWWVAGRSAYRRGSSPQPTLVASFAAGAHLRPPATCGVRMALERGRGAAAVPVWSGVVCTILGAGALIGAVTFAAGLDHLRHTPRVVGWNWDLILSAGIDPGGNPAGRPIAELERILDRAEDVDGVEAITYGTFFVQPQGLLESGPEDVSVMSLAAGRGSVTPTVTSGRAPAGPEEILFSPRLLHDQGLHVGDEVTVHGEAGAFRVRVVGTGILPVADVRFNRAAVSFTFEGLRRIEPDALPDGVVVDVTPDADVRRTGERLERLGLLDPRSTQDFDLVEFSNLDLRQADAVPRLLGLLMGILGAGVLVHLVATGVRARRIELATLRSLGFTPGQVRSAMAWQATTVVVTAVGIATVVGVIAGRAVWRGYAERLVVAPEPVSPWLAIVAVALAGLVLGNVVTWVSAGRFARRPPSEALRTE